MRAGSVPTSRSVPASTPSVRSVLSRATSTGLSSDGASSWMPPESVITKSQRASSLAIDVYRSGSMSSTFASGSSAGRSSSRTAGFGCIGRTKRTSGCERRDAGDALGDAREAAAPVLAAVGGHDDDPVVAGSTSSATRGLRDRHVEPGGPVQRVDAGVAGHEDLVRGDVLAHEVLLVLRGRREVQRRDAGDQLAVQLLRERRQVEAAGAQARLDVDHGDAQVERGQRGGEGRARVAVHDGGERIAAGDEELARGLLALQVDEPPQT